MKTIIKSKAVADFYLDTRSQLKNSKYPLKLRLTYQRKSNYIAIKGYEFNHEEWQKVWISPRTPKHKQIKLTLSDILIRVNNLIVEMEEYNFKDIKRKITDARGETKEKTTLAILFNEYINLLNKQDRYKSAEGYSQTLNSLISFKGDITIKQVDSDYLNQYEKWMINKGRTLTTIGMYLRNLRCIYNKAIEEDLVDKTKYPFSKSRYTIPQGGSNKRALQPDEIQKLLRFKTEDYYKQRAVDFWCFSYLSNGMNFKDIFSLRKQDLVGNKLTFIRQKTKRTTKANNKPIDIVYADAIFERIEEIIERWGNKTSSPNSYIFQLLDERATETEKGHKIEAFTKRTNKALKEISLNLIGFQITTYHARHSFATQLLRNDVNIALISEALGHKSIVTTQNYLGTFTDEERMGCSAVLI